MRAHIPRALTITLLVLTTTGCRTDIQQYVVQRDLATIDGASVASVWRSGELFVQGIRPAASANLEITVAVGSTRIGLAADYLFVGPLELPRAGRRGAPTPYDPSSGCIGIVLGFAL